MKDELVHSSYWAKVFSLGRWRLDRKRFARSSVAFQSALMPSSPQRRSKTKTKTKAKTKTKTKTNDERRTTNRERRTTNDERRTTNDERAVLDRTDQKQGGECATEMTINVRDSDVLCQVEAGKAAGNLYSESMWESRAIKIG